MCTPDDRAGRIPLRHAVPALAVLLGLAAAPALHAEESVLATGATGFGPFRQFVRHSLHFVTDLLNAEN